MLMPEVQSLQLQAQISEGSTAVNRSNAFPSPGHSTTHDRGDEAIVAKPSPVWQLLHKNIRTPHCEASCQSNISNYQS